MHKNKHVPQIATILRAASKANLTITPLIQTLGHLEWLLKVKEFVHLRDKATNSQVILQLMIELNQKHFSQIMCVAKEDAFKLLQSMVDEVITMHKKYSAIHSVHIGGDEVFEVVQNTWVTF